MDEKCIFHTGCWCKALIATVCSGENTACRFYKTEKQFVESRNRAVKINRAKGNCAGCKYSEKPCGLIQPIKCELGGVE